MEKISLYIAGKKVDLDNDSFILLNYTMEDLSNPTIVKNSFSKQITLKGTPANNEIFGNLHRVDRITRYGEGYAGIEFDPMRKTPFTIYNEMSEVLESGYVKVDKIVRKGSITEYQITLYGGLGSFFYGLMYKADGTKRSLFGMKYLFGDGTRSADFEYQRGFNHLRLEDAWMYLSDPYSYDWAASDYKAWNVVNFAPAYNGIPEKFSANKAVVQERFSNVPKGTTEEGRLYSYKSGTSSNLMVFANPHDAWRMMDLRWYLMRPVIRLKAIIEAICNPENNGGYEVFLDQDVFGSQNELIEQSWVTLSMISPDMKSRTDLFNRLLESTKSPGEYLVSLAKTLGLVFVVDQGFKRVSIYSRSNFYKMNSANVIDMSERIDSESISIKPVLADEHFYQMGGGAIGEWASQYKETYGIDYGVQLVNTGNEFNNSTKVITENLVYVDAVEVQERDLLFASNYFTRDTATGQDIEDFALPKYESVKIQFWNGNDMKEKDVLPKTTGETYPINPAYPNTDWLPKLQFHDANQKPADGTDVLIVFNGIRYTPQWTSSRKLQYLLTDDTDDMMKLNDNTPCWNFSSQNSVKVDFLPLFGRSRTIKNAGLEYLDYTWEWGSPKERGVTDVYEGTAPTIYNLWWKKYLTDRYDNDTFVLSCKANLAGLRIGQNLLGRFFYYQNAIFVLNKISNHSLTTEDETECEFIKVQDVKNYIGE